MRRPFFAGAPLSALALLGMIAAPGSARAEEPAPPPTHRLSAYVTATAQVYLSAARTVGGVGGGVGVRDTVKDFILVQADLSYLALLGNAASLRVAAGVQRPGTYSPAALLTVSTLFGDHLSFLTPEHPERLTGPALALGVQLAPLRFDLKDVQLSVLQLGIGVGSDFPGTGVAYSVELLQVGATF